MSSIIKDAIVLHRGAVSYGRGKVLELFEVDGLPLAKVQFDGDARPRPVRLAHLTVESALPLAVRPPVTPKPRLVYSRDSVAAPVVA